VLKTPAFENSEKPDPAQPSERKKSPEGRNGFAKVSIPIALRR
jgi:hypothetical protein